MKKKLKTFKKVLVANRGEIAIRILRALDELHITTVAVFSYEDRYSRHRYKADEAYQIGTREEPLKPYLDIQGIIQLAVEKEVDAIHPGYGFLSENVDFVRACEAANITFIGPSPDVMEKLGDKVAAKKVAREIDVPLIPDSQIPLDSLKDAIMEADRIGYPVMVKAASGGGGRGMRVVRTENDLSKAFTDARNEAKNAFGDDTVFLEKFLEAPKHLEVQILGDNYGNIVHLFERDCSVQRRFQKVIEIATSTLPQEIKDKLYGYALKIAKHVGYNNAGTVEFLVENSEVYFIEVNPRIQVEHTVTEAVTGIDIVRSQVLIAAGHELSDDQIFIKSQGDVKANGFAVQCRITTEDPSNDFQPDYGKIIAYRNAGGFGIRLDEGSSYAGVNISPFFDSMLVKVTASGRTLKGACQRMRRTLREFRIRGVKTNMSFLTQVMENKTFQKGEATVKFIENEMGTLSFPQGLDRGTKAIHYLANVQVNGNPDVKEFDPKRKFRTLVVPPIDIKEPFPDGMRQKLQEMGPDKFASWIKNEKAIFYTDTTFRDAHQSLLATRMRTLDMLEVAGGFARDHGDQVFSMEVWGGATFDVALRFLKECPWQRLSQLREAMPNVLLQMLLRGSNAVGYTAYPDNLIEAFVEKAAETGIDVFRIFDSLNWVEAMRTSIRTVRERTGALAEACISYTGDVGDPSRTKYDLKYYVDLAKQLEDEGAHLIGLKDMAGLLKPRAAELLVNALRDAVKIPIHLHTHDTSSIQSATYMKAIDAGVDIVDVALSSMSGLTSQPSFNSVAAMLQGHDRERHVDLEKLNEYSAYWEAVRGWYYPFETELRAGTASVYEHEIPGGQYSNLLPQARSLGLEDKFEEIKANYRIANELFGDIVKVTPSSKVVGDMAMFMTSNGLTKEEVMTKGESLAFPESVKSFFRGDLGQPYGGFPEELQKLVLKGEQPYTDRPNAHLAPVDFELEMAKFKQAFPRKCSELDFLSFKLYPKVFADFYKHREKYGEVAMIPTLAFFYPMEDNEEILVKIDEGKIILIRYMYMTEPNDDGLRSVFFKINGQTRSVDVRDEKVAVEKITHRKAVAENENEIGSPLQGRLSTIHVKTGDKVEKNQPLFVIEAMKMESSITASVAGVVRGIHLEAGVMVGQDDLVVEME